jgi:hypothetical protein
MMSFIKASLGESAIKRKFMRRVDDDNAKRAIQRWCAVARDVGDESVRRNPAEHYQDLLDELADRGHSRQVIELLEFMANRVGCTVVPDENVDPDKSDWKDEVMDDYPTLAEFHEACRSYIEGGDRVRDVSKVKELCDAARREISETYVKVVAESLLREPKPVKEGIRRGK